MYYNEGEQNTSQKTAIHRILPQSGPRRRVDVSYFMATHHNWRESPLSWDIGWEETPPCWWPKGYRQACQTAISKKSAEGSRETQILRWIWDAWTAPTGTLSRQHRCTQRSHTSASPYSCHLQTVPHMNILHVSLHELYSQCTLFFKPQRTHGTSSSCMLSKGGPSPHHILTPSSW